MQTCVCVCVVLSWSKDIIHPSLLLSPLRRYNYTHTRTQQARKHTHTRKHSDVCCCLLVSNSKSERRGGMEREGWAEIMFYDIVYEFVQLPRRDVCFCLASTALPYNQSVFLPHCRTHPRCLRACTSSIYRQQKAICICTSIIDCVCVCGNRLR